MTICRFCGDPIRLIEIGAGPSSKAESFWHSDNLDECSGPEGEHLPPQVECECCFRMVDELPYHHDNHNPPYDGYDYCADCNGCGGPSDCCVPTDQPQEATDMSSTITDLERAELMLSMGMGETGEALTDDERTQLQAYVDAVKGPVDPQPLGDPEPTVGEIPQQTDLQALVQAEIQKAMGGGIAGAAPQSLGDVLKRIDPRDSDAALELFNWLADNGRLSIIGQLNGGGYLLHYTEPKGTTKAGYSPGGTQGGRMVDQAVAKAKDSGAVARQTGMCDKCWSAVEQLADGSIVSDDETKNATCPQGGAHTFNS